MRKLIMAIIMAAVTFGAVAGCRSAGSNSCGCGH